MNLSPTRPCWINGGGDGRNAATSKRRRDFPEKSYLLAVLDAFNANLDPALELAAELDKAREELRRERVLAAHYREQAAGVKTPWEQNAERLLKGLSGGSLVPTEQWRRLVQLAHPDKHDGSPAAVEATRWLLENRP